MWVNAKVILPDITVDISKKAALKGLKRELGFEEDEHTKYQISETTGLVEKHYTTTDNSWWWEESNMDPEVLKAIRVLEEALKEK